MARRRHKRRVSYRAALTAAVVIVARREVERRSGMALWGPLATRLLTRRFGPQATTRMVKEVNHWAPIAARFIAERLGYHSASEMSARLGSQLLRRMQGKRALPQP